jgi:hypothetical protein
VIETNSVVHIEVEDGSTDEPVAQTPSVLAESVQGLRIVEKVCDRWGTYVVGDRNRI